MWDSVPKGGRDRVRAGVMGPSICLLTTKACGQGITLTGERVTGIRADADAVSEQRRSESTRKQRVEENCQSRPSSTTILLLQPPLFTLHSSLLPVSILFTLRSPQVRTGWSYSTPPGTPPRTGRPWIAHSASDRRKTSWCIA